VSERNCFVVEAGVAMAFSKRKFLDRVQQARGSV
jgi:hypothetical protein